jgi:hypothetical protein
MVHFQDSRGLYPIHIACMNTNPEGPDIVETLLEIDHLAARQADPLGQVFTPYPFSTLFNHVPPILSTNLAALLGIRLGPTSFPSTSVMPLRPPTLPPKPTPLRIIPGEHTPFPPFA